MSDWNRINGSELDRHITGNYGEDQFRDDLPDYSEVPTKQLKHWLRQYRKAKRPPYCVAGHAECGCTNVPSNAGAPCSEAAQAALEERGDV